MASIWSDFSDLLGIKLKDTPNESTSDQRYSLSRAGGGKKLWPAVTEADISIQQIAEAVAVGGCPRAHSRCVDNVMGKASMSTQDLPQSIEQVFITQVNRKASDGRLSAIEQIGVNDGLKCVGTSRPLLGREASYRATQKGRSPSPGLPTGVLRLFQSAANSAGIPFRAAYRRNTILVESLSD